MEYKDKKWIFGEKINDLQQYNQLERLIREGKDLPDGIICKIGLKLEDLSFYKEYSNDDLHAQPEISKANSLDSIATTLRFFKILVIVGISVLVIGLIILLIIYLSTKL